jgi:N-acyl-D-aspartate/D-glutamate deacylase
VRFLRDTFTHPLGMVSTDAIYVGKRPHPRGFGTYPKVLGEYVRDNGWLTFEQAIYKMSGYPAQRFRIPERGLLKEGYYADIVVVDPQTVAGPATFDNPRVDPSGIEHVFVNGKFAVRDGRPAEGLWGRLILKQS